MGEMGHQLGELFLGAVPTVLILIVLYFVLRFLFFKPLLAVMAEREARIAGAQKAAEAAQAAAAEKVKQYQDALKQARAKVYAEQEVARNKHLDERAALLKASRNLAATEVSAAKEKVAKEVAAARRELEAGVPQLAAEIARRVLESPSFPREAR
jgi:F-type H+-transporting ATPase subunit b